MTTDALPEASTPFGRRVRYRLRDVTVWLTYSAPVRVRIGRVRGY